MSSHSHSQDAALVPPAPLTIRQLGTRLDHIYQWVITEATANPSHYTDIWDLCCDHGRLGMHLSQAAPLNNSHIHLVDCVPSILENLHARYSAALNPKLSFTLADAGNIEFIRRGPQAIIIAGVGGRTIIAILAALLARGLPHQIAETTIETTTGTTIKKTIETAAGFTDFFISPNSDAFELRCFIKANHFALIKEEFVSENGFHHEHLLLRHGAFAYSHKNPIAQTDAGQTLWLSLDQDKKNYLNKLLKHHQLSYQFKHLTLDREAADAYQTILANAATCASQQ